jgi:hypothetical protein
MQTRLSLGLSLLLILLVAGCSASPSLMAADEPDHRAALEARLKKLLLDRVATAKRAVASTNAAFEAETVTLGDLIAATQNVWKAELAVASTPEERIAAHVRHVQFVGRKHAKIEALYKVGARGGEAEKYNTSKHELESAQIALVEECIAAGREYPAFEPVPFRIIYDYPQ